MGAERMVDGSGQTPSDAISLLDFQPKGLRNMLQNSNNVIIIVNE